MRPDHDPLARWLDAEREDLPDEAEAALFELMASLPPRTPAAGFADRVLARVVLERGLERVAAPARRAFAWRRTWIVALGLLLTGILLVWLPLAVLAGSPAGVLQVAISGWLAIARWLSSAAGVGQTVLTVAEAIAMALARPQIVVLTVICLALSVTSFRFLRGLVSRERSWAYVDPV